MQSGIQHSYFQKDKDPSKVRLPITPSILHKLKAHWLSRNTSSDIILLWAAATVCFFGFFRAGEITVPTLSDFDEKIHLAWGDVAIDNPESPCTNSLSAFKKVQNRLTWKGSGLVYWQD